uniref:SOSEKI DIX-like domain-containing protein n=1 Tax=Leersia perrieri TaxID=77586 RepID=A0A0D9VAY1_9ORYZ
MANARDTSGRRSGWWSPERTPVWTEPQPNKQHTASRSKKQQQQAVLYYLCRQDGQLDHPHFVQVPCVSDPPRLRLRDVIARLSELRGAAMAGAYSWSAKRTYRNGYVWQDLTADDVILPAHAHPFHEYVLKGSPLLMRIIPNNNNDAAADSHESQPASSGARRKKSRWTSFDLADYKLGNGAPAAELIGIDEISSPPPSSSSPDDDTTIITQQQLDKIGSASAAAAGTGTAQGAGVIGGGRMRATAMLMHLISCGSINNKLEDGRRARSDFVTHKIGGRGRCKEEEVEVETAMDRDYFSGSLLLETNRTTELRRSSSCNADSTTSCRMGEVDGVRTKLPPPPHAKSRNQGGRAERAEMAKGTAVSRVVKEKRFWIASFLVAWAAALQGHMMWMQRQDSFKQKFPNDNQDAADHDSS